jgi:hypothetical protein
LVSFPFYGVYEKFDTDNTISDISQSFVSAIKYEISVLKINNGLKHTLFYLRVEYLQEKSLISPSCCLKFQTLNKIPSECDNIPAGVIKELPESSFNIFHFDLNICVAKCGYAATKRDSASVDPKTLSEKLPQRNKNLERN